MKYDYLDDKKNKAKKDTFWQDVGSALALVLFVGLCVVLSFVWM